MLDETIQAHVAKATVKVTKGEGQGVLVGGNIVLTATHCIEWEEEGQMVLGEHYVEEIETSNEEILKVKPLAVEPVSDMTALGPLDDQTFSDEYERFCSYCEATDPVSLCLDSFELSKPFRVYIYTPNGTWVEAKAEIYTEGSNMLWFDSDEQIKGGTSGGPIVNESGELVGITSNYLRINTPGEKSNGTFPCPHLSLPVWILNKIRGSNIP